VLSIPSGRGEADEASRKITWILVAANNRPLGRGGLVFATTQECRDAVASLRRDFARARSFAGVVEATHRWTWRVDVDGSTVAVSSRSYLRARECDYNLHRFLEAVPEASLVDEIRVIPDRVA
jgi:hypothetical protein